MLYRWIVCPSLARWRKREKQTESGDRENKTRGVSSRAFYFRVGVSNILSFLLRSRFFGGLVLPPTLGGGNTSSLKTTAWEGGYLDLRSPSQGLSCFRPDPGNEVG